MVGKVSKTMQGNLSLQSITTQILDFVNAFFQSKLGTPNGIQPHVRGWRKWECPLPRQGVIN